MARVNYLNSEHGKKVLAFAPQVVKLKTPGTNFLHRTHAKNQLILRHVCDRLVQTCGPYDGLSSAVNYTKSGVPRKLASGRAESPFDVHMLTWELELVDDGLIQKEEILSIASMLMAIRWAITTQKATDLWRVHQIIRWRRPAVQAGFILLRDQLKMEELNFPHGYKFGEVTKETAEEHELDV